MSMDFNPNQPAKTKNYHWATYIPGRNPTFKIHHQSNHAKSAFQYRGEGILYKWNGDKNEWEEVFRLERDDELETCPHGGSPRQPTPWNQNPKGHNYRRWVGKDENSRLIAVCNNCHRHPQAANVSFWGDNE